MIGLSFVAFLDILGFGDMVIADCESANPGELYLPSLKSAIHEALSQAKSVDARISQFSDSIVLSSPFSTDTKSFEQFLDLVNGLQSLLFSNKMLCRGGVSHGRHFHDETFLFSQALIDAYRLESKVARDPRILVSTDTLDLLYPKGTTAESLLIDEDGQVFLNYLGNIDSKLVSEVLSGMKHLLSVGDPSIRSKIAWLFKYARFCNNDLVVPPEIQLRKL